MCILNQAYMLKLAWNLVASPDKILVRVMKAKYGCGPNAFLDIRMKQKCTNTWKAICSVWEDASTNISWSIQNGKDVRFWKDRWIHDVTPLATNFANNIPVGQINFPIFFMQMERLNQLLPEDVCIKISTIKPLSMELHYDFPNWSASTDGKFSLKSAYTLLIDKILNGRNDSHLFKLIWKWKGRNKVCSLLWQVAYGRLMNNEERQKINMIDGSSFSRCQNGPESIMHVLTDSNLVACYVLVNRSTTISYLKPLLKKVLNLLHLQDWSATFKICLEKLTPVQIC